MQTERNDTNAAKAIMERFAERTGVLRAAEPPRRYLWTDAFAVCNFLGLHRATGAPEHLRAARALVEQVHAVLGRHRTDDSRSGWVSGLTEAEGRAHPTRGGLRIGKPLPERAARERFDERQEWDRDGQYFHYLTKWMHALARIAAVTQEASHLDQAVELARVAHAAFTYARAIDGGRLMHWKMSIDLRRPLVASMGQHDPLDGLLACLELRAAQAAARSPSSDGQLDDVIADLRAIEASIDPRTNDLLGIGGLLTGAYALAQLIARGVATDVGLLQRLLAGAAAGTDQFLGRSPLALPARHRLAFRELGLAIGLHAVPRIAALWERDRARLGADVIERRLDALRIHVPLAPAIEDDWLDARSRDAVSWTSHLDINEVMLATSLSPDGYLTV